MKRKGNWRGLRRLGMSVRECLRLGSTWGTDIILFNKIYFKKGKRMKAYNNM